MKFSRTVFFITLDLFANSFNDAIYCFACFLQEVSFSLTLFARLSFFLAVNLSALPEIGWALGNANSNYWQIFGVRVQEVLLDFSLTGPYTAICTGIFRLSISIGKQFSTDYLTTVGPIFRQLLHKGHSPFRSFLAYFGQNVLHCFKREFFRLALYRPGTGSWKKGGVLAPFLTLAP